MNYKRRVTLLALIFVFLMQGFYVKMPVKALAASKELKVSSALTQWVLDEPTNTLYAISEAGKNLLFINAATMTVEKSLTLDGKPTDIIIDGGKLYIALDEIRQIAVVDMSSRSIIERLKTASDPYRIVKDGDKIYYTEFDQHCDIYEYNLVTKSEQRILVNSMYQPDIAINPNTHVLYIGESNLTSIDMIYYSTIENKVIGSINSDDWTDVTEPSRNILYDGTKVYFAGRDFDPGNAKSFEGDFGAWETVLHVSNGLVYTDKAIYNKNTHARLGDYGYEPNLIEASNNTLYIYNKDNGTVKSFNDSNKPINSANVIALISGNAALPVQTSTQSVRESAGLSALEMNSRLIQWILDEPSNTLYGISEEDKALFFINSTTLNLEKTLIFATSPTDIFLDGGKLYLSLEDANQIAVVDIVSRTVTEKLKTSISPYRLVKDGDKVYYSERDGFVYGYNLLTNTDQALSMGLVGNPDLTINTKDHILYIGESDVSGSNMFYYSTTDNKLIGKSNYNNGYGFYDPSRIILFDGEKVYYAGYDFDKKNPEIILGSYEKEVLFAKYGIALTNTSLYDSKSYTLLQNYGGGIDLYEISQQGVTYYYNEEKNSISKVDLGEMALVQFDSQGGSEVETILADNNSLIKAPAAPKNTGYTFGGWYKDVEGTTPWNFSVDKVTGTTTLYAKWTIGHFAVKFISNGGTIVQDQTPLSWDKVTKPLDPTRAGYEFGGWYTDQYPFTKMFDFNALLDGDTNLFARWIPTEAYIISYMQQTKDTKLFGVYNQAKAVILESNLSEVKKGYYLGELAKYDSAVFTDINKYFINRCIEIAANPNLTDFLALVDEIDAKLDNDIDRGYFKGQMNSWGRYQVYTPEVQASIDAIVKVWTLKTPESIEAAKAAIAKVKQPGSVTWLNNSLDEAVHAISK